MKRYEAVKTILSKKGEAGEVILGVVEDVRDGAQLGEIICAFGNKVMLLKDQGINTLSKKIVGSVKDLMKEAGMLDLGESGLRTIHEINGYSGLVFTEEVSSVIIKYFKSIEIEIEDYNAITAPAMILPARVKAKTNLNNKTRTSHIVEVVKQQQQAEVEMPKELDTDSVGVFMNRNMPTQAQTTRVNKPPQKTTSKIRNMSKTNHIDELTGEKQGDKPQIPAEAPLNNSDNKNVEATGCKSLEEELIEELISQIKSGSGKWIGKVTASEGALWVDRNCLKVIGATSVSVNKTKLLSIVQIRKDMLLSSGKNKIGVIL
jgi:hypothetical protein